MTLFTIIGCNPTLLVPMKHSVAWSIVGLSCMTRIRHKPRQDLCFHTLVTSQQDFCNMLSLKLVRCCRLCVEWGSKELQSTYLSWFGLNCTSIQWMLASSSRCWYFYLPKQSGFVLYEGARSLTVFVSSEVVALLCVPLSKHVCPAGAWCRHRSFLAVPTQWDPLPRKIHETTSQLVLGGIKKSQCNPNLCWRR